MKNFLLTAVIAASAAMPVMAGIALPYSETFDTAADFATMTVVDANSDNKTWYHSDYYKSAMIDYSDDSSMDDWLIMPAFSLAPGGTYTFEMDARCYSSFLGTERFEVKMGTAATAAAMTETVVGETLLKTDKFQHFTQKITVATAGTYYIGIHCISDGIFKVFDEDGWGDRFSITDFYIQECAKHPIYGIVPKELRLIDVGKFETLSEAEEFVRNTLKNN